jgi:hypothetical protein
MNTPADDTPPNDFERAILLRIADENPSITSVLKALLPALRVSDRDFTGVGSFTTFVPGAAHAEFTAHTYGLQSSCVRLPGLEVGLDAILFSDEGKPDFVDFVNIGNEPWDGRHEGFRIE